MSRFKRDFINTLDSYKCKNPFEPLKSLPIFDKNMIFQGYLRPVTQDYKVTIPGCAGLLSKWRNENSFMSPDPFVATPESTENWLNQSVLARGDRILFLIISGDGTKIGHIGFSVFDEKERSLEIDAVIRGEKNVCPGIMTDALNTLIRWGLDTLKIKKIGLRVLSDNTHAIHFYKKSFFFKTGDIPLFQVIGAESEAWTPERQNANQSAEKYYTKMQLDIQKWKKH